MKTVKRLDAATVIEYSEVNTGKIVGFGRKTSNSVSYAVVNENGEIVKDSRGEFEIYPRKSVAQMAANWYNSK